MTYKDIKLAVLQKMFYDVTDVTPTALTKPYLDKMAYACNGAMGRITAAGFGKRKYAEIILAVPENLLGNDSELYKARRIEKELVLTAPMGKSCFFEMFGKGTFKLFVGNKLTESFENTDGASFKKYKMAFSNEKNENVRLVFEGRGSCLIKNVAVYSEFYENNSEIYEISEMKAYNLGETHDDFYKLDGENSVICLGGNTAYGFMGDSVFTVGGLESGMWRVPYIAYPKKIDEKTEDGEEIELPEYLCGLIPYYVASELYLEDDSGLCVGWRNKFEAELREYALNYERTPKNRYKIVSMGGDGLGDI